MPIDNSSAATQQEIIQQIHDAFVHNLKDSKKNRFRQVMCHILCEALTVKYPKQLGNYQEPITIIKDYVLTEFKTQLANVQLTIQAKDKPRFKKWLNHWAQQYYDSLVDVYNNNDIGHYPDSYLMSLYFGLRDYQHLKISHYPPKLQHLYRLPLHLSDAMSDAYSAQF